VVPEPGPLTRALIRLARQGHDDRHLGAEVCRACVECLDVHGAAISLSTATASRQTLSATDATAATLEDLQFTLGEGACMEAAVGGRPVLVPDVHDQASVTRWPVFARAVAEQTGVRALFALPLQLGTINLGVLDLYRTTPGPLRGHELREALAAADAATSLLLAVPTHTDGADGPGSDGWWNDRAEVHQATGMVLVQLGVPAQDALVRLRAHAFATCRPLADVARDVVTRRLVFTPDMD
jgi:GAF domain/ANTAR domain